MTVRLRTLIWEWLMKWCHGKLLDHLGWVWCWLLFTSPLDKAFPSVIFGFGYFLVYGFLVWLSLWVFLKVHLYHIFGLKFSRAQVKLLFRSTPSVFFHFLAQGSFKIGLIHFFSSSPCSSFTFFCTLEKESRTVVVPLNPLCSFVFVFGLLVNPSTWHCLVFACLFVSPLVHCVNFWHHRSKREQERVQKSKNHHKVRGKEMLWLRAEGFGSSSWSCDWLPWSVAQSWLSTRSCGLCSNSLEEQEESGLEHGEGLMPPINRTLLDLWMAELANPMAVPAAMGSSEGWLRKKEDGSPDLCPPEPPSNTLLAPSRLEMGAWPPLAARAEEVRTEWLEYNQWLYNYVSV